MYRLSRVPYSMPDQDYILNDLDSTSKTVPQEDLVTLGKALAERLLPAGPVREAYKMAVAAAGKDRGVRLRLICRTPKLARLPWEYTYDPLYSTRTAITASWFSTRRSHWCALSQACCRARR